MRGFGWQRPAFQEVAPKEAQQMRESNPEVVMIDVREPYEYAQIHAKGVKLIPLATLGDHLDEVPRDKPVLVICHSGGRSAAACDILISAGYDKDKIYNVQGGTSEWAYEDLPVEQGQ